MKSDINVEAPPEKSATEEYTIEDEFILADINVDEYIDCFKDVITTTDIQTISDLILQNESEDVI